MSTAPALMDKDPGATLDYSWDWTAWLADVSDTIAAFTITPDADLTLVSSSRAGPIVTAFLSGGALGKRSAVVCKITTTGGRIEERSIYLNIKQR